MDTISTRKPNRTIGETELRRAGFGKDVGLGISMIKGFMARPRVLNTSDIAIQFIKKKPKASCPRK